MEYILPGTYILRSEVSRINSPELFSLWRRSEWSVEIAYLANIEYNGPTMDRYELSRLVVS